MGKRGKLSLVEKMAIKGGYSEGQSIEEIAEALDRTPKAVNNYVEGELDEIAGHIAQAQMQAHENGNNIEEGYSDEDNCADSVTGVRPLHPKKERTRLQDDDLAEARPTEKTQKAPVASETIIKAGYRDLIQAGLTKGDANRLVKSTIDYASKKGHKFTNEKQFYYACIARMNAGQFMIKTSQGGNEGVAIMTGAASTRAETSKQGHKPRSRSARGAVYNPSTGEIE